MKIRELILRNRSYRRFLGDEAIEMAMLRSWVDLARCSGSARNAQSLKYLISNTPEKNALIFPNLAWAGYLTDWDGPEQGERPSAYILVLNDLRITDNYFCDHGISSQSILLGAVEAGFGGCIIASIKKKPLQEALHLAPYLDLVHVIALGKPNETVKLEDMQPDGDFKYWRDKEGIHHVPKRSLDEIILKS